MWVITGLRGGKKEKRENQQLQNTVLKVRRNTNVGPHRFDRRKKREKRKSAIAEHGHSHIFEGEKEHKNR